MRLALRLAWRGYGTTSPNPMVGAVLVKNGKVIGRGWHRRAGLPHAEIEALRDAQKRGQNVRGATLYVTLEPCCTHGRTPPCTDAIVKAGVKRVVVGTVDPNPKHAGKGITMLKNANIIAYAIGDSRGRPNLPDRLKAELQTVATQCMELNEAFNHWIVHRTPFVTLKAAMTLDGKIATAEGESKWITGPKARDYGMKLRQGNDAILVGINTILSDNPALTIRSKNIQHPPFNTQHSRLRRIVLDSMARTPLKSKVAGDNNSRLTTIVVSKLAPKSRVEALAKQVDVLVAPTAAGQQQAKISLPWLLRKLGAQNVTSLLVEGGGEVNASFLMNQLVHRLAFFYAPKILGGRDSRKAAGGIGVERLQDVIQLRDIKWKKLGADLLMTARIAKA
jgi:diaminohydroxyphosphoribosylaminopyrimidine deaminase/5-amino-6-(5-phosphoribosylamino)uracil reductase